MTKQTVGYVDLEWTCPNCGNRNPGTAIKCVTCGNPQPDSVEFEAGASGELLTDEEKIARAQAGPDVACPYCGTRNLATAERCKQCGGDLQGGEQREAGRVVGAYRPGAGPPIVCDNCGSENPATATKCANCGAPLGKPVREPEPKPAKPAGSGMPRWLIPAIIGVIVLCIGFFAVQSLRRSQDVVEVQGVQWQRRILVEALVPVTRSDWEDQLPAGAEAVQCKQQVRRTSQNPEPNSVEVCGTPYIVDTGTGVGEVVKDCEYEVYDSYCDYRTLAWVAAPVVVASGTDYSPHWPEAVLDNDQREAGREETYSVILGGDGETYRMSVRNMEQLQEYQPGSRWRVEVNGFGNVVDIQPAR
ncbi:MAG: zinc ribbon domain-containing protein [Anaerolineae bacterium]|nr:zinc ribbon domain-containing protein [Anaerolineae bacterium]